MIWIKGSDTMSQSEVCSDTSRLIDERYQRRRWFRGEITVAADEGDGLFCLLGSPCTCEQIKW